MRVRVGKLFAWRVPNLLPVADKHTADWDMPPLHLNLLPMANKHIVAYGLRVANKHTAETD